MLLDHEITRVTKGNLKHLLWLAVLLLLLVVAVMANAGNKLDDQLMARNAEFKKDIIKVSDSVYTAVGYGVSTISMIVGQEGVVIVDTGIDVNSAKAVRADFRKIVDKPVKAIIFTHGHGDHTGGVLAFMDTPDTQIWARQSFGDEQRFLKDAGIHIQKLRGARQAGFMLSPEQRINNGIAKAYWPKRGGNVFSTSKKSLKPTHFLQTDQLALNIAGIELKLVATGGETKDHLYVWMPSERVAFSGDNFYKSWPNLYAIRGSAYRDIKEWATVVDQILKEEPHALVGGHTRPIIGAEEVTTTLTNYRDAIRFVFDKTVEGINMGMTPNQLVDYVVLPEKYHNLDYLQPYYGNPEWAIRSIFNGYLGWFDGNASNLFPLSDKTEAMHLAKMAGGVETLISLSAKALAEGDYQWAAQLSDHILALKPDHKKVLLIKADALTKLAENILTTTARNYYLTSAKQLRERAKEKSK